MGGIGSGRQDYSDKNTVEKCLTLRLNNLIRGSLLKTTSGSIVLLRKGKERSRMDYEYLISGSEHLLIFQYSCNGENVRQKIRLDVSPQKFGGFRYRFMCPLITNGIPCLRRCETLHTPPGNVLLGCRKCYDLTYRSSQESHADDFIINDLAQAVNIPPKIVRKILRHERKNAK